MKSFYELIEDPASGWDKQPDGRSTVWYPDGYDGKYTIELEPLIGGQWYIAIYHDGELLVDKIPVRPGGTSQ